MDILSDTQIHGALGDEGLTKLVAAFYKRVPTDDILGPMYPKHELAESEVRLREFLIQRFGGSTAYSDKRGHPRLRMRHAPFHINMAARNRWMRLMEEAMVETQIPENIASIMRTFFSNTATFMINQFD